jgi:hypothetical protein
MLTAVPLTRLVVAKSMVWERGMPPKISFSVTDPCQSAVPEMKSVETEGNVVKWMVMPPSKVSCKPLATDDEPLSVALKGEL